MECKFDSAESFFCSYFGINRYIMECKWEYQEDFSSRCPGINRYIMECKSYPNLLAKNSICELIDTLWNVNYGMETTCVEKEGN